MSRNINTVPVTEIKMYTIVIFAVAISSLHLAGAEFGSLFLDNEEDQEFSSRKIVEPLPCGHFDLYINKFSGGCRMSYLTSLFKRNWKGIITGKELMKRISKTCSKFESYRKCAKCIGRHECPEENTALFDTLMEEWSVFCDQDQVAGWLTTILQKGYSYNTSLDRETNDAVYSCFVQLRKSGYRYNHTEYIRMSFAEGLDYFKTFTSLMFKCTVGEILANAPPKSACSSSWQDILLTHWLSVTTSVRHGFNIYQDEKKSLQKIRC